MNKRTRQIIDDILKYKGKDFVLLCALEEMSELSKAILKNVNRNKDTTKNLVEEMCDVIVCMEYIKHIYNISDSKVSEIINRKMAIKWPAKIKKWKTGDLSE